MKIDQKLLRIMGMAAGIIIIFIVIIALISGCNKNKKYSLNELETKLITLSKNYYQKNKDSLPKNGEDTSLSISYFIENKNFKKIQLTSGESCTGEVKVINSNGYYLYTPMLTCGDIKPIKLSEKLIEQSTVTVGEGLYKIGESHIFRGETLNNYLLLNDKLWRIIKINGDGTVRIIEVKRTESSPWDNRYNIDKRSNLGINDFISNNINSRIKNKLEDIYNSDKYFKDDIKAYFATQDLCIGKRSEKDEVNNYLMECNEVIEDQVFGLIYASEYIQASLDPNCENIKSNSCTNYNFLARLDSATWTLTADKDTSHKAFKLDYGLSLSNTSSTSGVSLVGHLNKNVLYKEGQGTKLDPYIIK